MDHIIRPNQMTESSKCVTDDELQLNTALAYYWYRHDIGLLGATPFPKPMLIFCQMDP